MLTLHSAQHTNMHAFTLGDIYTNTQTDRQTDRRSHISIPPTTDDYLDLGKPTASALPLPMLLAPVSSMGSWCCCCCCC